MDRSQMMNEKMKTKRTCSSPPLVLIIEVKMRRRWSFSSVYWGLILLNRDEKEMKAGQAKISVETAKDVQTDATLKTKAEKDRRLR